MKRLLALACLSLFAVTVAPDAFAWRGGAGAIRGPGGGGVARGPAGGVAVRGPGGGAAYARRRVRWWRLLSRRRLRWWCLPRRLLRRRRGRRWRSGRCRSRRCGGFDRLLPGALLYRADVLRLLRLSTLLIRSGFRCGRWSAAASAATCASLCCVEGSIDGRGAAISSLARAILALHPALESRPPL